GIRDLTVTGVQTCALPISGRALPKLHCPRATETSPRTIGAGGGLEGHRPRESLGVERSTTKTEQAQKGRIGFDSNWRSLPRTSRKVASENCFGARRRREMKRGWTTLIVTALGVTFAHAQNDPASEPAVIAVAKVLPAVVNINTERVVRRRVRDPFEDFAAQYFGNYRSQPREIKQTLQSLGSGFIIDSAGYIVTNEHVVQRAADLKIEVTMNDGKVYNARYITGDEKKDLALIKIEAKAEFPLIDLSGRLVGISSAKMAFTPQGVPTQGLGFAIPADTVRTIVAQFREVAKNQPSPKPKASESEPAGSNAQRLFGMQLQNLTAD